MRHFTSCLISMQISSRRTEEGVLSPAEQFTIMQFTAFSSQDKRPKCRGLQELTVLVKRKAHKE